MMEMVDQMMEMFAQIMARKMTEKLLEVLILIYYSDSSFETLLFLTARDVTLLSSVTSIPS